MQTVRSLKFRVAFLWLSGWVSLRVFCITPGITPEINDEWFKIAPGFIPKMCLHGVNTWVYSQGVAQKPFDFPSSIHEQCSTVGFPCRPGVKLVGSQHLRTPISIGQASFVCVCVFFQGTHKLAVFPLAFL